MANTCRAMCAELIDALLIQEAERARALLAEADGPAVLDGREPASVPAPVAQPVADGEYREAWDMSSDQGSECFASAIISRLCGYEEVEEDLRLWLAAYLRVNALPIPPADDN